MERVVAWPGPNDPGYVNLHWNSAKVNMAGRPFRELDAFMGMAQWAALHPANCENVWFCTSTQAMTGKVIRGTTTAARHAQHAIHLKAIWLDIDVKPEKGYATIIEALQALKLFREFAGLPPPSALVASGSGLHVYWISDRPLTPDEWRPYAEGLRAEAERFGLRFDAAITTDAARILRVPGTYNSKTSPPKAVRLLALENSYAFAVEPTVHRLAELGALVERASVTGPVTKTIAIYDLSGFQPPSQAFREAGMDVSQSLSAGCHNYDDKPLDPAPIFQKCPHFLTTMTTGGASYPQGLWMLDVLATTFWEDGETWAHALSKGYKAYSADETRAMFERKKKERGSAGLGWPSCSAFANEGAKECAGCPFKGRIRSPLNLAVRQQAPQPPPPAFNAAGASTAAKDLMLPDGYCLDQSGRICKMVEEDIGGQITPRLAPLFYSKIRNIEMVRAANASGYRFETSLDMDSWGEVFIAEELVASEQQMLASMRRQGVKPFVENERAIRSFMTSWSDKIDGERRRLQAIPMGWVFEDGKRAGFAYGGKVYRADGTVTSAAVADPQFADQFHKHGTLEPWIEALKVITEQKHPALEAIVALAFAAPLMWVPAEYNGILCAYSDEGGAGKTTAIKVGLAVWSNPKTTKENVLSTIKGTIRKLGFVRNLPIYFDEINRQDRMVAVQGFLDIATEGAGPTTLRQDRTFNAKDEWQTLVGVGANTSFWELIKRKAKNTDAQLRRVFEIKVEKREKTRDRMAVSALASELETNYGVIGDMYAQYLARNHEAVYNYVHEICTAFDNDVNDRMEDRFWASMVGTMVAGAGIANALDPRIQFNIPLLYDYLKGEFLRMRRDISNVAIGTKNKFFVTDQLGQFFDEIVGNIAWTDTCPMGRGKPPAIQVLRKPSRDDEPIYVRIAVNERRIFISKAKFEAWANEHEFALTATYEGMRQHLGAKMDGRIVLSSGLLIGGMRQPVIEIPVKPGDGDLEDLLYKYTPPAQRPPATP